MLRGILFVVVLSACCLLTSAQVKPKEEGVPADKGFPTTLQPVNPVKYYAPKTKKKKTNDKSVTYNARDEYYDRIEGIMQEREKRELSGERARSSEKMKPPYFGHRKPPKIRPIGKRKQCKVCGIRH